MLSVRRALVEDAPAWRDIRLRALADAPTAFGSTLAREQCLPETHFTDWLAGGLSVLGFEDDEPVGMGSCYEDLPGWLHIVAIWVEPVARGRGLNGLILEELIKIAESTGHRVHLEVAAGNDVARRSYERFGFVGTGETTPLRERSSHVVERMVLPAR
jgi:ribosomal protein S18 acetylase RimI-like enzyme